MSEKPLNRAERALALLEQRYPGWVPAIEFEAPCGRQAWRTALSEARTLAKQDGGDIDNRQQRMEHNGEPWTLSEYRLVKAVEHHAVPQGHNLNDVQPGRLL